MQRAKKYILYTAVILVVQFVLAGILSPNVDVSMQEFSRDWIFILIVTLPIFMMVEEILFRFIPFKMLHSLRDKRYFLNIVYVMFFIVSGIAHTTNIIGNANIIEIGKYFFIQGICGIMLGYIYLKDGIFGSYWVHMLYDFVLLMMLFMMVPV